MEREIRTGLVLEGGGMRGVFTCGVLDWLLDNGWSFPYTVGVSAGACNGLSYMSRQREGPSIATLTCSSSINTSG